MASVPSDPGNTLREAGRACAPAFGLRPLEHRHDNLFPLALILSALAHLAAIFLVLISPAIFSGPVFKGPMMVRLVEIPAGRGGKTQGTPGATKALVPSRTTSHSTAKEPKTSLPGKAKPKVEEKASPVKSPNPGVAAGLGHEGAAGLGGKGAGVILDEANFQYAWYKARLEDLLKSHWRKPMVGKNVSLSTSVHFTITAAGDAINVRIVSSSGNAVFDQTVLRAVYGSAPFPRFPPQYDSSTLGVMYTFELVPKK